MFRPLQALGAHFGLTPRKYQSDEIDRTGRISKVGERRAGTARCRRSAEERMA
jgi:transposase